MSEGPDREPRVGGWLLVLCGWLAVWKPLNLASVAAAALAALEVRGWPLGVLLVLRLAVAALGMSAAMAILNRRPLALSLTRFAIIMSAGMELLVYSTSVFPNNRLPGTTPFYLAWTIVLHGTWLVYLSRSSRVRRTLE